MKPYNVTIIGGGPAGLMCSLYLAKWGYSVLILEKMQNVGRKLLLSGLGQCNLTHTGPISDFLTHYGEHGRFIKSALMNFSNDELIRFFNEHGIHFIEHEDGKIFPESGKSRDILTILTDNIETTGVKIHTNEPVQAIAQSDAGFMVTTTKDAYLSAYVVLATGGFTYPSTGSTGDGYILAKKLGHTIIEPGPALAPVIIKNFPFRELAGMSFPSSVLRLFRDNKKIHETKGDILITHQGLSGPAILDFSRYIRKGDELRISFIPSLDNTSGRDGLTRYFSTGGIKQVKTLLTSLNVPERFAKKILEIAEIPTEMTCAQFPKKSRNRLISLLLEYSFPDLSLGDKNEAMVTRGGVSIDEIRQDTMESKVIPGLYCIGEVLDIDGDCGGYNLQAAFSTGVLAAASIHKISVN